MEARLAMCELMASELGLDDIAGVGSLRRDLGPEVGTSAELFRTLRALLGGPGVGRLTWALGADVFEGMHRWSNKAFSCLQPGETCDGLILFMRAGWTEARMLEAAKSIGHAPCQVRIVPMPADLAGVSSHYARHALVRGGRRADGAGRRGGAAAAVMLPSVARFCASRPDVLAV